MIKNIGILGVSALLLAACGASDDADETLTEYTALGTEPGWTVELKDGEIIHTSQEGDNDFTIPLNRVQKTETGWKLRGFTTADDVKMTITTGQACNDGMSDREYADTVTAKISKAGTVEGCGGEITKGGDTAP